MNQLRGIWWILVLILVVGYISEIQAKRNSPNCGFACYRWKKCKKNISILTNSNGNSRPGQSGTTGQLFFSKCGDPPEGCECKYEPPKVGPPKPKLPRMMLSFVNQDAADWISNLVELV